MVAQILIGPELVTRRLYLKRRDIVFVKGIFEASEGVGLMFAEDGGSILLAAPVSRAGELDELVNDLVGELEECVPG